MNFTVFKCTEYTLFYKKIPTNKAIAFPMFLSSNQRTRLLMKKPKIRSMYWTTHCPLMSSIIYTMRLKIHS